MSTLNNTNELQVESQPLLSTKQVAELWGISEGRVLELCANGQLRAIKFSARLFRFDPADVVAAQRRLRAIDPAKDISADSEVQS